MTTFSPAQTRAEARKPRGPRSPHLALAALLVVSLVCLSSSALAEQIPQAEPRPAAVEPAASSAPAQTLAGESDQNQEKQDESQDTRKFKLSLGAGEEYCSNVNDSPDAKSDFVSMAETKAALDFKTPRLSLTAAYSGEARIYALGNRSNEIKNSLNATAKLEAVRNLLFLEASDQNQLVYKNTALGDPQSADSTSSQINQNTASASIYLAPRLSDRWTSKFGYKATGVLYSEGGKDKLQHLIFFDTLYQLTPSLEAGVDASAMRQISANGTVDRRILSGVLRYTYAKKSYVFTKGGVIFSTLISGAERTDFTLNAGWRHTFGRNFFDATVEQGYKDNPETSDGVLKLDGKASIGREFSRGDVSVGGGYSKYTGSGTQTSELITIFAKANYQMTSKLKSSVQVSRERNTSSSGDMTRWYVTGQLVYDLPREASLTGYYKFKLSNSDRGQNDYQSNIIGIKITKTF